MDYTRHWLLRLCHIYLVMSKKQRLKETKVLARSLYLLHLQFYYNTERLIALSFLRKRLASEIRTFNTFSALAQRWKQLKDVSKRLIVMVVRVFLLLHCVSNSNFSAPSTIN